MPGHAPGRVRARAPPGVPVPPRGRTPVRTTDVHRLTAEVAVPVNLGLLALRQAPHRARRTSAHCARGPSGASHGKRQCGAWGPARVLGAGQRQPNTTLPCPVPGTRGTLPGPARARARHGRMLHGRLCETRRMTAGPAVSSRFPGRRMRGLGWGHIPGEAPGGPCPCPQGRDPGPDRLGAPHPGRNVRGFPGLPGLLGSSRGPG